MLENYLLKSESTKPFMIDILLDTLCTKIFEIFKYSLYKRSYFAVFVSCIFKQNLGIIFESFLLKISKLHVSCFLPWEIWKLCFPKKLLLFIILLQNRIPQVDQSLLIFSTGPLLNVWFHQTFILAIFVEE